MLGRKKGKCTGSFYGGREKSLNFFLLFIEKLPSCREFGVFHRSWRNLQFSIGWCWVIHSRMKESKNLWRRRKEFLRTRNDRDTLWLYGKSLLLFWHISAITLKSRVPVTLRISIKGFGNLFWTKLQLFGRILNFSRHCLTWRSNQSTAFSARVNNISINTFRATSFNRSRRFYPCKMQLNRFTLKLLRNSQLVENSPFSIV